MPKKEEKVKRKSTKDESDLSSLEDEPVAKKSRGDSAAKKPVVDSETGINLGDNRFLKVRNFKNRLYIDIREFYTDAHGELKPGKKGICLKPEQWAVLKSSIEDVDALLNVL